MNDPMLSLQNWTTFVSIGACVVIITTPKNVGNYIVNTILCLVAAGLCFGVAYKETSNVYLSVGVIWIVNAITQAVLLFTLPKSEKTYDEE